MKAAILLFMVLGSVPLSTHQQSPSRKPSASNSQGDRLDRQRKAKQDILSAAADYRASLQKLLLFQENDAKAAADNLSRKQSLFEQNKVAATEVEESRRILEAANDKVKNTRKQIAEADSLLKSAGIESTAVSQSTSDRKHTLDYTIDEILDLIDVKALALIPTTRPYPSNTAKSNQIERQKADQLKETFVDVRRRVNILIKDSGDLEVYAIKNLGEERKMIRELADHGVIKFEEGSKRQLKLLDKEQEIQTEHASNALQLLSDVRGLLFWESEFDDSTQKGVLSKGARRNGSPLRVIWERQAEIRTLLEDLKTNLGLRKDWLHRISNQK